MEQIIFNTKFSNIGFQHQLRMDSKYRYFKDEKNNTTELLREAGKQGLPLGNILEFATTETIKRGELVEEMILVDLENIEPGFGALKEENTVTEIGSDKTIFNDADIVYSKLTPEKGHCFLNDKSKKIIGTTELIGYKVKNKNWNPKFLMYLLIHKSFRSDLEFLTSGKTHPRIHIPDFFAMRIPFISYTEQTKIVEKIERLEEEIISIKRKIESLQDIIDDVFVQHGLKSVNEKRFERENILIGFSEVSNNFYLRNSSLYHIFWAKYKGALLEQDKFVKVRLGDLIMPNVHRVKKGLLEHPMILLNFEDIEPYTGRILNLNYVEEIGSDKNILIGNDVIISKMNNHLGYVFTLPQLSGQKDIVIGSSEFIPYLIKDKTKILPEFIKYILLVEDFLNISKFLRSGKSQSHPRIHIKDLLSIKIPLPDLKIQQKIISEIQQREEKSNQYKEEIKKLREEIDNLIYENLKNG